MTTAVWCLTDAEPEVSPLQYKLENAEALHSVK